MSAASDKQENCENLDGKRKENENKKIVRGNNSEVEAFVAEDNTRYNINDSAYFATGADIPYAIGTIKEIKVSKKDFATIFVKSYYRTTELPDAVYQMLIKDRLKKAENSNDKDLVSRKECRTRELFLCKEEDAAPLSFPVSKLRGKCSVTFLEKFNDARDFDFGPDCFFYLLGFNTDLRKLSSIEGDSCEGSSFKWTATERGCLQKATIPDLLPRSVITAQMDRDDEDDGYEKLVWEPGRLLDTELLAYIRNARSIAFFIGMCDGGSDKDGNQLCQRDGTTIHALKYLVDANYCPREAINHLIKNPIPPTIERKWTEEQVKRFVKGLRQNGKDFVRLRKDHLPAKTRAELVEFYYIWKKGSDNLMIQPQSKARRQATIKKKGNGEPESANEIETESEESEPETPFICRTCQKSISENRSDHVDLCSKCRVIFYKYGDDHYVFDMIDFDAEPEYESDIRSEFSSPFDVDHHHHNSGVASMSSGTPHFMFKPIKEKMNEKSPSPPNNPPKQQQQLPSSAPPQQPQPTTTTVKIDQQQTTTTTTINNQQSNDNNNDSALVKSESEKKAFKRQWDGEESGHEVDDGIGMKRLKTNEQQPPPQPPSQQQQEQGDAVAPSSLMDMKPTTNNNVSSRDHPIHRHWSTPTTQHTASGEHSAIHNSSRRLYDLSAPNNHPQPPQQPQQHVTEQLPPTTTTDLQHHHHPHHHQQPRGHPPPHHHHMSSIVTSSSNNFTASSMSVPSAAAPTTNHMIPPPHHHPRATDDNRKNNVIESQQQQQQNYPTNCDTKSIQQSQFPPTEQQQSTFQQPTNNHNPHPRNDSHYTPQPPRPHHEPQRHEQHQQRPQEPPQRPQEQHQQRPQHESQQRPHESQRQANEQHEQQQQRCSEIDVENIEIYPPVFPHHHITLRPGEQIPANFQFYTEPRPYTPGKYNRVHETKTFKFYGHPDSTCSRTDFVWKSLKQQELMKQEQQKHHHHQQQQRQQHHNEDTKLFDPEHHHHHPQHHRLRDNMTSSSRYEDRNIQQQQQDHQARGDHVVTAKREIIRPVPVPVNHHPSLPHPSPHVGHTNSRATPTGGSGGGVMTSQQHASSVYDLHRPRSSPYTSRLENSASRTLRHYASIGVTSQRGGDHPSVMTSSSAAAANHYSAFDSMQAADREMRERELREIQREQLSKSAAAVQQSVAAHITSSSSCSVSMNPSVMTSSSATSSSVMLDGHKLLADHHTSQQQQQQQVATAAAIEQFNAVQAAAMGAMRAGVHPSLIPPPGGAVEQLQRQSFAAGLLPGMGNSPHPLANAGFPPILPPHDFQHNLDPHNRIPTDRLNHERLAMEQQFRMDLMQSHHQHAHIHSHLHLHQPNTSSTPSAPPQMLNGMIPNTPTDPLGTYNSMIQQIQAQQQAFAGIDVHTAAMMANPLNPLLHLSGVRPPTSASAPHPSAPHPSSYLSAANLSATQQLQAHAAQEQFIEQRAIHEEFYRFANAANHNHKP